MCRGLAVLVDRHGRVICKGLPSHSGTAGSWKKEDKCLKYEIIVTDKNKQGYRVEIDENFKEDKEHQMMLKTVKKWAKENETKVLRYLLHCQSYADRKGITDNSNQKSEEISNGEQEAKHGINNKYQKAKYINNHLQYAKLSIDNSFQQTDKEWYMGFVTLKKYPNTTKLLRTVKNSWDLTLPELCRWIAEHPEEAKKILGDEGK